MTFAQKPPLTLFFFFFFINLTDYPIYTATILKYGCVHFVFLGAASHK